MLHSSGDQILLLCCSRCGLGSKGTDLLVGESGFAWCGAAAVTESVLCTHVCSTRSHKADGLAQTWCGGRSWKPRHGANSLQSLAQRSQAAAQEVACHCDYDSNAWDARWSVAAVCTHSPDELCLSAQARCASWAVRRRAGRLRWTALWPHIRMRHSTGRECSLAHHRAQLHLVTCVFGDACRTKARYSFTWCGVILSTAVSSDEQ
jgi:hypothetical protein